MEKNEINIRILIINKFKQHKLHYNSSESTFFIIFDEDGC